MGDRVAVMRRGQLEQVDTPQQLYDRPLNVFVGGFIGSPAMNMIEARLEPSNGTLAAAVGSQRIVLGDEKLNAHPALRAYAGRTVILGIRPEDLEDAALAPETAPDRRLRGSVVLREALGSEIVAHFDIDARPALTDDVRELAADVGEELTDQAPHTTMVGRFRADSAVQAGQQAEVAIDTRALHFFDPDTGAGIYDTDSRERAGT
jgi:multiple sugar transport system ATP-binding protein